MWNNPCGGQRLCERADWSVSQNSLTTSPNKHSPPTLTPRAEAKGVVYNLHRSFLWLCVFGVRGGL